MERSADTSSAGPATVAWHPIGSVPAPTSTAPFPPPPASTAPFPSTVPFPVAPFGTSPTSTAGWAPEPDPMAALGSPSPRALPWAAVALVTGVTFVWLAGDGINRLALRQPVDSGAAYALFVAAFLVVDVALLGALRIFAAGPARFTSRMLGLVRPFRLREALLFGVSAWIVAVMAGGAWIAFVVPDAVSERERVSDDDTAQEFDVAQFLEDQPQVDDPGAPPVEDPRETALDESAPVADRDELEASHQLLGVLQLDPPMRYLLVLLFGLCIGAPLFEELFFRGFLMRSIGARFGASAGLAVSSVIFGVGHLTVVPWEFVPPLAFIGAGLGWLFLKTGSVVPGIAVHAFVNSLSSGVALGWGWGILGLIVGSWAVLGVLLVPFMIRPREPTGPMSLSTGG